MRLHRFPSMESAALTLRRQTNNMVDVIPVSREPAIVGVICTVKPPPVHMIDKSTGMAQFVVNIDRRSWEAIKTLVDGYFNGEK